MRSAPVGVETGVLKISKTEVGALPLARTHELVQRNKANDAGINFLIGIFNPFF
jgi:hypothetical protein